MPSQMPSVTGTRELLQGLRDPGRNLRERYRGDPLALAERFGVKLPLKPLQKMKELGVYDEEKHGPIEPGLREMVIDVCTLEVKSAVACANRGGGKSFGVSFIEFYLWVIESFDALNLGGSELQADQVYQYLLNYLDDDPFWMSLIRGQPQREKTFTNDDAWVRVLAASQKSVRSPHAGGLRKGKVRGGILVIDEEAEADEGIVEAALPTINTARPSVNVRCSTFHNIGGSFQNVIDNHEEMGYCVDAKTEILTQRGWLHGEELQPWDKVLSVDSNGTSHWGKVKRIYRNPNFSGKMLRIKQRYLSGMVTGPHRLLLADGRFTTADELNQPFSQVAGWRENHQVRLMGGAAPEGPGIYSDDFVELASWFVAEGHWIHSQGGKKVWNEDHTQKEYRYYKGKIVGFAISQNPGPECDRIRNLLKRMNISFSEKEGRCHVFVVRGQVLSHLLSVCSHDNEGSSRKYLAKHGKALSPNFCTSLTQDQRMLFLETFLDGDGSRALHHERADGTRYVQRVITQNRGRRSDSVQMIATLAGIPTTQTKQKISLRTSDRTVVYDKHMDERHYDGLIWCPETEHGTWVSRRDGIVSVTGNTLYRWDIFDVCSGCDCTGDACESPEPCFREDHYEDYIDPDDGTPKQRLLHKAYCSGRAMYADGWIPMEEIETLWRRMKRNHNRWEIEAMGQRPSSKDYVIRDITKFSDNLTTEAPSSLYLPGSPVTVCVDWGTSAAGVSVWQEQPFDRHVCLAAEQLKDNNQTQVFGKILEYVNLYKRDFLEVAADAGGGGNYLNPQLRSQHRIRVRDVYFNEEKESAVGAWNMLNEGGKTIIPDEFSEFVGQVKEWKRKNERIQKGNDHICDSAICYFAKFVDRLGTTHMRAVPKAFSSALAAQKTAQPQVRPGSKRPASGRVPVAVSLRQTRSRRAR